MEIKASLQHLRRSPRKVRLVLDLVRGMETKKALDQLRFCQKEAAVPVIKLVNSAIANAVNNFDLKADNLYIKEIKADEGRTLKRWLPRAHGRATVLRKRSSHIHIVLAEIKKSDVKGPKKQKLEAPVKLGKVAKEAPVKEKKGATKEIGHEEIAKGKEIFDPRTAASRVEPGKNTGHAKSIFRRKAG
jgi:large subunit ribosomal protein L22